MSRRHIVWFIEGLVPSLHSLGRLLGGYRSVPDSSRDQGGLGGRLLQLGKIRQKSSELSEIVRRDGSPGKTFNRKLADPAPKLCNN